jgi:hypothetical protein
MAKRKTNKTPAHQPKDMGHDLTIKSIRPRGLGVPGTWVTGTLNGHYFEALAFKDHAENPEYELGQSRVSKMYLKCLATKREVFHFDRGTDIEAQTPEAADIVGFLCEGIADLAFAGE